MDKREIESINMIKKEIKYNTKELSESIGKRCYIRDDLIFNSYGNIIRPLNENEIELYDKIKIFKNVLHFYLE